MIQIKNVCPVIRDVFIVMEKKIHNAQNVTHPFISTKEVVRRNVLLTTTKISLPNLVYFVIDSVLLVKDHWLITACLAH